jgi:hypothetical protein
VNDFFQVIGTVTPTSVYASPISSGVSSAGANSSSGSSDQPDGITLFDLLSFAYQIACGMEFLSSKNVSLFFRSCKHNKLNNKLAS